MTSFWSGDPTFPVEVVFGASEDRVTIRLHADGTFDCDLVAARAAMERSRGAPHEAAILAWILLRTLEKG